MEAQTESKKPWYKLYEHVHVFSQNSQALVLRIEREGRHQGRLTGRATGPAQKAHLSARHVWIHEVAESDPKERTELSATVQP